MKDNPQKPTPGTKLEDTFNKNPLVKPAVPKMNFKATDYGSSQYVLVCADHPERKPVVMDSVFAQYDGRKNPEGDAFETLMQSAKRDRRAMGVKMQTCRVHTEYYPDNAFPGRKVVRSWYCWSPKHSYGVYIRHMFGLQTEKEEWYVNEVNALTIRAGVACLRINNGQLEPMDYLLDGSVLTDERITAIANGCIFKPETQEEIDAVLSAEGFTEKDVTAIKHYWKIEEKVTVDDLDAAVEKVTLKSVESVDDDGCPQPEESDELDDTLDDTLDESDFD